METQKRNSTLSIIVVGIMMLLSTTLTAQERVRVFEIATPDLGQFSLRYKFGTDDRLFRISAIGFDRISRIYEIPDNKKESYYTMGIGIGIEFPKELTEKMTFHYGFGAGVNNLFRKYDNNYKSLGINASGILGFNYKITNGLRLGAEIQPHIGYSETKSNSQTIKGTNLTISSSNALIVMGFAF